MDCAAHRLEKTLRRDIDESAGVRLTNPKVSAYLASAYNVYEVNVLGTTLMVVEPVDAQRLSPKKLTKGAAALGKALKANVVLYLPLLSSVQRRALIEGGQAFITHQGNYYLPQLALSFAGVSAEPFETTQPFTPAQQLVFLYCLYTEEEVIEQSTVADVLGLSSGSVSASLARFVKLRLVDYVTGGKTGRKKAYFVHDKKKLYEEGSAVFGSPIRRVLEVPTSLVDSSWPKSGLSALAERSDLLPPDDELYAITTAQAAALATKSGDSLEHCRVQVLKYNPLLFASDGCVDPFTMLRTIDDNDERISLAVRQAMGGCEWYQA